jgi:DNA polymerase-3 subunit alpha
MPQFSHLHVHTQFSLLDGAADITSLYKKAVKDNMPALAITDHGNMFGAFKFVAEAGKHNTPDNPNKIKPIVGCEFYVVENRHKKVFTKDDRDVRNHQLFLAKDAEGYKNLVKLCSLGFIEGLYSKYPRIDKELILQYHKGLIATTCCIGASVPRTILRKGEADGEKEFKWWLDLFGEDYYVEIQRHDIPEQNTVNEVLLGFAKKYNVKVIASNDSHYVNQEDSNAHDILLCINTGEKQSTPTFKDMGDDDGTFSRGKRFAFYNDQFYFKTTAEMCELFADVPESIDNTNEIVSKIQPLKLKQDILLPHYQIPDGFQSQDDYLKHITLEGAKKRYQDISPEIEERLNFELFTVKTMGFAGYFLIVADFIRAGRDLGVLIGPGRGSAAGSAVAYCIGITNIDPIKYNLLFERFLNPDRKSMPDIDTDFDDEGRQKVIDYVVDKYGKNQVAQIVTYGTMAAKSSIKDVARVMDLPLPDANALAKLVSDRPGVELDRLINAPLKGENSLEEKEKLPSDDIANAQKLRTILDGDDLQAAVLKEALVLEGSVRGTGIHAAGIIIAPKDLTEIIPVCTSKETNLLITQYEGKIIEDAGVIKMDFLGLRTLSIIRDALILIEQNHGVKIDIDTISLDDKKTFELFQKGLTVGIFQFEAGHVPPILRDMKPTQFEDLIALNALNRPGPLAYIPNYVKRKHGKEAIVYDLPEMEEYLKETYGITVYQEQVMLLSQKLAGFTKGDADVLRKAMGKKDRATLDKMKSKFMEGAQNKNHPADKLEKIWKDWESFAEYAFNKSHSTCYAFVAFQTAYLKAHYPAEYMASVLTHNLSNIDKVTFFMDESKRIGIPVLGPDVNESQYQFAVNKKGEIRFGLGAVKGVGEAAVASIIQERTQNGPFANPFDLVSRINLRAANKKTFESLAYAGAFDFYKEMHRAQYFHQDENEIVFLEKILRWGAHMQEMSNSSQASLFDATPEVNRPSPKIPQAEEWGKLDLLRYEKEVLGVYLSGHPLDNYKFEMKQFCPNKVADLKEMEKAKGKDLAIGGTITMVNHQISKNGKPYCKFTIEDFEDAVELFLFGQDYINFKPYLNMDFFVFMRGKIQERFNQPDNLEFKISSVQLLSELREKMCKNLTVSLPVADINDALVEKLLGLVSENNKTNKPTCSLKFMIYDADENISVEMPAKKMKVNPDSELISALENMPEVKIKVN